MFTVTKTEECKIRMSLSQSAFRRQIRAVETLLSPKTTKELKKF